mgnify:CR=1 FL=1
MNNKQRFIFRIVLAIIFLIGGFVYLFNSDFVFAIAFWVAGLAFGYKAIKDNKDNKEE